MNEILCIKLRMAYKTNHKTLFKIYYAVENYKNVFYK